MDCNGHGCHVTGTAAGNGVDRAGNAFLGPTRRAFVFSTRTEGAAITFLTSAPTNGSTALIPINSTMLCRGDNPATPESDPETVPQ